MTFSIHMGWWMLPLAATITSFASAAWRSKDVEPGHYGAGVLEALAYYWTALTVSLIAWLIWALLT